MLAVRKVARELGNIEVRDVPEPSAGPDQVVIRVDSAGLCGTDLHIYFDEFETRPPVTMGHEVAGRIVEVGRDVTGWKEGDRVTTLGLSSTLPPVGGSGVGRLVHQRSRPGRQRRTHGDGGSLSQRPLALDEQIEGASHWLPRRMRAAG